jgi:hypothetical protein
MDDLKDILLDYRALNDMTQTEASVFFRLSLITIQRIESGKKVKEITKRKILVRLGK